MGEAGDRQAASLDDDTSDARVAEVSTLTKA
ncbi:unnamed protein product, partial [marine sediment metagenome]